MSDMEISSAMNLQLALKMSLASDEPVASFATKSFAVDLKLVIYVPQNNQASYYISVCL